MCGWRWNLFDFIVVALQVLEEVIACFSQQFDDLNANFSIMRVLRVLRLVRIVRLVRVMRLIRDLHTIVCSIAGSFKSFVWTVIFIGFVIYINGVFLCQMAADQAQDKSDAHVAVVELYTFFGSLPRAFLTLFQAITGGISWNEPVMALINHVSPLLGLVFSFYIAFAVLALLNVVTGVFVESAMESAKNDEDMAMVDRLRQAFQETDVDGSGIITWDEFEAALDEPGMEKTFQALVRALMNLRHGRYLSF